MATWDRYKNQNKSGFELIHYSGSTADFRSYCDDPTLGPVGIYIAKEPFCKLKMTPTVQFANTNIAWDISQSGSTTSTVDEFDITWGGTTDIGDLAAQDWSVDPKTGNVQYTTVGTYTADAYVTDLLAAESKHCKTTIQIINEFVNLQRAYVGTTDGGCFYIEPDGTVTQSNTGLTGNHTNFRSLRMHPAYKDLPTGQHHLWAATQDGVAYTTDGTANWNLISEATLGTPANEAMDSPAPTASDPDNIDVWFDPQDVQRVYLHRTTTSPNLRSWLYYTDDYGSTWNNIQLQAP